MRMINLRIVVSLLMAGYGIVHSQFSHERKCNESADIFVVASEELKIECCAGENDNPEWRLFGDRGIFKIYQNNLTFNDKNVTFNENDYSMRLWVNKNIQSILCPDGKTRLQIEYVNNEECTCHRNRRTSQLVCEIKCAYGGMLDHTEFNTSGNGRIEKKISREQAYRCYAGYDVPNDYSNDEEILCSVSQHLNNGYYVHKTSCSCPFKDELATTQIYRESSLAETTGENDITTAESLQDFLKQIDITSDPDQQTLEKAAKAVNDYLDTATSEDIKVEFEKLMDIVEWVGQSTKKTLKGDKFDVICGNYKEVDIPGVYLPKLHRGIASPVSIITMKTPNHLPKWPAEDFFLASDIISVTFANKLDLSSNPLRLNFTYNEVHYNGTKEEFEPVATFWNASEKQWKTDGCEIVNYTSSSALVACNHTTSFAVLMQVKEVPMGDDHDKALGIITLTGLTASNLFLAFTVLVHILLFRVLPSERIVTIVDLGLALIAGHTVFLLGISNTKDKSVCRTVGILMHYFYLTAFFAMLVEGIRLMMIMLKRKSVYTKKYTFMIITVILTWALPGVIVGATVKISDYKAYNNADRCWLATGGWIWTFVGPVLAIIVLNVCVMFVSINVLVKGSVELEKRGKLRTSVWNVFMMVILLGIPWITGILAVHQNVIVFNYIFTILNTLQGFFLFLMTCILDSRTRGYILVKLLGCQKKTEDEVVDVYSGQKYNATPDSLGGSPRTRATGLSDMPLMVKIPSYDNNALSTGC